MRYWMVMILTAFMSLTFSAPANADRDREHMDDRDKEHSMETDDASVEQSGRMNNELQSRGAEKDSPWWWPF